MARYVSKRLEQGKFCSKTGKTRHKNRKQALDHLHRLKKQDGDLMSVYRCWHCGDYHLGHDNGKS